MRAGESGEREIDRLEGLSCLRHFGDDAGEELTGALSVYGFVPATVLPAIVAPGTRWPPLCMAATGVVSCLSHGRLKSLIRRIV